MSFAESLNHLRERFLWPELKAESQEQNLRWWQNRVLYAIYLTTSLLGFAAYLPSVWLSLTEGLYVVAAFDTAAYAVVLLLFFKHNIDYLVRAVVISAICYLVGAIILAVLGPFGAGPVWLFAFPIICGVLLGIRVATLALAINAATLVAVGIWLWSGTAPWVYATENPLGKWSVIFFNFLLLNTLATISLAKILKGLQATVQHEKHMRLELEVKHRQLAKANLNLQSEMKRRQSAMREIDVRDRRLKLLAENALDCIWQMDKEFRFVYVNPAVSTLFGFQPEAWIGTRLDAHCSPDEFQRFERTVSEKLLCPDGSGQVLIETELSARDGHLVPVEILVKPLHDTAGDIIGWHGSARNISERKKSQRQRKHLEAQLRQSQRLESIGTLVGGIAHDFNNLLSPVLGYAELVHDSLPVDSPLRDDLEQIIQASRRAKALVHQLLIFSRQSENEHQPIEIGPIIVEAVKLMRASLPASISLEYKPDTDAVIRGDPTQVHQVVMNLLINAGHAIRSGNGTISIRLQDVESLRPGDFPPDLNENAAVCLTIRDSGGGMTPEVKERIFDPFFTTRESGKGTGMGLAVVHGIVKSHHGAITVESQPGRGSAFRIYFPKVANEVIGSEAVIRSGIPGGSEWILLVDDEPSVAAAGARLLESLGYRVTVTHSSAEALQLYKATPARFELVITDLTMPRMPGDQLAQELLSMDPSVPIILCSGFQDHLSDAIVRQIGIRRYLQKPVSRSELGSAVREVLDEGV